MSSCAPWCLSLKVSPHRGFVCKQYLLCKCSRFKFLKKLSLGTDAEITKLGFNVQTTASQWTYQDKDKIDGNLLRSLLFHIFFALRPECSKRRCVGSHLFQTLPHLLVLYYSVEGWVWSVGHWNPARFNYQDTLLIVKKWFLRFFYFKCVIIVMWFHTMTSWQIET